MYPFVFREHHSVEMVHSSPERDFPGGIKLNKNKSSDRSFGGGDV